MTAGELSPVPREARPLQGEPAGLLTRSIAGIIDGLGVVLFLIAVYVGFNGVRFLAHPIGFQLQGSSAILNVVSGLVVLVVYLMVTWSTSGRSYGDHVMGLRVVDGQGGRVGPARAGVRAACYVVFPLGLVWCAGGPAHRSVQDMLLRTAVVYDWRSRPGTELALHRSEPDP